MAYHGHWWTVGGCVCKHAVHCYCSSPQSLSRVCDYALIIIEGGYQRPRLTQRQKSDSFTGTIIFKLKDFKPSSAKLLPATPAALMICDVDR